MSRRFIFQGEEADDNSIYSAFQRIQHHRNQHNDFIIKNKLQAHYETRDDLSSIKICSDFLVILLMIIYNIKPDRLYNFIKMVDIIEQFAQKLQLTQLDSNPNFSFVQKKIGVKPSAVIIAILVFLLIVTLISNATSIVIAVGCCCVPAYMTFTVMESQQWDSIKKCLIYWIIYAILEVISPLLALILPSSLYVLLRTGIALAIMHPQSSIGLKIYDGFIGPFLQEHEKNIDNDINKVVLKGKNILEKGKDYLSQQIKKQ